MAKFTKQSTEPLKNFENTFFKTGGVKFGPKAGLSGFPQKAIDCMDYWWK